MGHGVFDPEFEEVTATLDRQIADAGEGGAAVSVYHNGKPVVDYWCGARNSAGDPWEQETLAMSFSTTKGVTATSLHMCVDRGLLDYDDRVAEHWPEFGQRGKEDITVRQILCHEAGLYQIRSHIESAETMNDWDAMIEVLEKMEPAHIPGEANGYHGLTFGWLAGELVRRTSGLPIGDFVSSEIAEPLELDGLFIGLPASEHRRLAELLASGAISVGDSLEQAGNVGAMAAQMGAEVDFERIAEALQPRGIAAWMRDPKVVEVAVPAANGCFTARSLARMYAALAGGGEIDGVRLLSQQTLSSATEIQNQRPDLIIVFPMMWRLGYHMVFTSKGVLPKAFGHFGFGGSGAWADPERNLAVAMTLNRLGGGAVGDMRMAEIGGAAVACAEAIP